MVPLTLVVPNNFIRHRLLRYLNNIACKSFHAECELMTRRNVSVNRFGLLRYKRFFPVSVLWARTDQGEILGITWTKLSVGSDQIEIVPRLNWLILVLRLY